MSGVGHNLPAANGSSGFWKCLLEKRKKLWKRGEFLQNEKSWNKDNMAVSGSSKQIVKLEIIEFKSRQYKKCCISNIITIQD